MTPTREDIDVICNLVNDLCGVYLDESKDYLIEGRLSNLLKTSRSANYRDFAQKVRSNRTLQGEVVDAITTNETLWFRDNSPFEALKFKIIPELIDAKASSLFPRKFRILSAACSTGQEAYSIAMAFADTVSDFESWDLQITGTDISPAAVATAEHGEYSQLEVSRGLEQRYLGAYFLRSGTKYRVNDVLKKTLQVSSTELVEATFRLRIFRHHLLS